VISYLAPQWTTYTAIEFEEAVTLAVSIFRESSM
jgi:hypothetical protein